MVKRSELEYVDWMHAIFDYFHDNYNSDQCHQCGGTGPEGV